VLTKQKREKRERALKKPEQWRIPGALLFRMFILGSVAIVACIWALYRHYSVPRMPMVVPIASSAVSGELPAPPLETVP